jgi:hypothetical protein
MDSTVLLQATRACGASPASEACLSAQLVINLFHACVSLTRPRSECCHHLLSPCRGKIWVRVIGDNPRSSYRPLHSPMNARVAFSSFVLSRWRACLLCSVSHPMKSAPNSRCCTMEKAFLVRFSAGCVCLAQMAMLSGDHVNESAGVVQDSSETLRHTRCWHCSHL